ncbi:hypothetical protein Cme02nite_15940 [Catellatospora methionotrophica]|uniref:Uncharacterized protein n=1 Tax=Catellatospora methionotrophica TaxID=121620 RepID=A0A8J3PDM6_9ACTN|nr:hypothetical protein Cme02nite_15940 [Catellatospora methionotrophica]
MAVGGGELLACASEPFFSSSTMRNEPTPHTVSTASTPSTLSAFFQRLDMFGFAASRCQPAATPGSPAAAGRGPVRRGGGGGGGGAMVGRVGGGGTTRTGIAGFGAVRGGMPGATPGETGVAGGADR